MRLKVAFLLSLPSMFQLRSSAVPLRKVHGESYWHVGLLLNVEEKLFLLGCPYSNLTIIMNIPFLLPKQQIHSFTCTLRTHFPNLQKPHLLIKPHRKGYDLTFIWSCPFTVSSLLIYIKTQWEEELVEEEIARGGGMLFCVRFTPRLSVLDMVWPRAKSCIMYILIKLGSQKFRMMLTNTWQGSDLIKLGVLSLHELRGCCLLLFQSDHFNYSEHLCLPVWCPFVCMRWVWNVKYLFLSLICKC